MGKIFHELLHRSSRVLIIAADIGFVEDITFDGSALVLLLMALLSKLVVGSIANTTLIRSAFCMLINIDNIITELLKLESLFYLYIQKE